MSKAAKFWVAFGFAVIIGGLTALASALGDNVITPQEYVTVALAFFSAGAVWFVPNAKMENDIPDESTIIDLGEMSMGSNDEYQGFEGTD